MTVPVTQQQFDAMVSLAFNVGAHAFSKSTLVRKLNAGDVRGAADEFLRWNKAGGQVLDGLVRRRRAERDLFLTGVQTTEAKPMAPFIAAALPALIEAVPALIRSFGKGEVTERNAKAAEVVLGVAKEAIGAKNEQELVEKLEAEPDAASGSASRRPAAAGLPARAPPTWRW